MADILIVDDDPDIRGTFRGLVEAGGHMVAEAADGQEAINRAWRSAPDIAIIDIIMPNHDGFDAIRHFRLLFPKTRIIAVSGGNPRSGREPLEFARSIGADEILSKPFQSADLCRSIERLLAAPSGTDVADVLNA